MLRLLAGRDALSRGASARRALLRVLVRAAPPLLLSDAARNMVVDSLSSGTPRCCQPQPPRPGTLIVGPSTRTSIPQLIEQRMHAVWCHSGASAAAAVSVMEVPFVGSPFNKRT